MSKGIFGSFIMREMNNIAVNIATDARGNASWSRRIPRAISVGDVSEIEDSKYSISIIVDLEEAPEAAAFEYGSGEHGEKGKRYRIPEELGTTLEFPKSRWPQYQPPPDVPDMFYFTYVMHPGVAPRPYLAPAIRENMKTIRGLLAKAFMLAHRESSVDVEFVE